MQIPNPYLNSDPDSPPLSPLDRLKNLPPRTRLLSIVFVIFILLIVSLLIRSRSSISQKLSPSTDNRPPSITPTIGPPPKVNFNAYENTTSLPVIPKNLFSYTFKNQYTQSEILSLGTKLGLSSIHSTNSSYTVLTNTQDKEKLGMLSFYPLTGRFAYQSFSGLVLPAVASAKAGQFPLSQNKQVESFLLGLGVSDNTVTCNISYERKDTPNLTYFECHRDWDLAGLPILSSIGVVNIAENKPLSSLLVGQNSTADFTDKNIINTSVKEDGLARPNDFNTITVALDKDNKVWAIDSSIRKVVAKRQIDEKELLSPTDALTQFMNHKSSLSLTLPGGSGLADSRKVYPNNLAQAKKAKITDFILTYLENHPTIAQKMLVPMYLIKGTAELDSGYAVRFTETIPALSDGTTSLVFAKKTGNVAGDSIELGTFLPITPSPTRTPTPSPTPSITSTPNPSNPTNPPTPTNTPRPNQPTPTPTDIPDKLCTLEEKDFGPIWDLGEMGKIGARRLSPYDPNSAYLWFLPNPDLPWPSAAEIINAAESVVTAEELEAYGGNYLDAETLSHRLSAHERCPVRISGGSPTLFVYGPSGTYLNISPQVTLTYTDPPIFTDNVWKVTVNEDKSLLTNGYTRNFLYYEYKPVKFTKPKEGWTIPRSQLDQLVQSLSSQFALLPLEKERLLFELKHASFDIDSEYLFIGVIPQSEIDQKLPLSISPRPDSIVRLHFSVSPTTYYSLPTTTPVLRPISRTPFMILELGAAAN